MVMKEVLNAAILFVALVCGYFFGKYALAEEFPHKWSVRTSLLVQTVVSVFLVSLVLFSIGEARNGGWPFIGLITGNFFLAAIFFAAEEYC